MRPKVKWPFVLAGMAAMVYSALWLALPHERRLVQRSALSNAVIFCAVYWFLTSPRFARFRREPAPGRALGQLRQKGVDLLYRVDALDAEERRSADELVRLVEWVGPEEHFCELIWQDGKGWPVAGDLGESVRAVREARAAAGLPALEAERLGLALRPETEAN